MAIASLTNVEKHFGRKVLFEKLDLAIYEGERVGFIGANGAGKSTLFKMLTGEETPDQGTVAIGKGYKVGYLVQNPKFDLENTVIDEAELGFAELHDLAHRMRDLEHKMAEVEGDALEKVLEKYQDVQHEFDLAGGYAWQHKMEATLLGVGLGREMWEKPVSVLSGGRRGGVAPTRLLLSEPDLLLLDEPTNHLDLAAIEWLEGFLARWKTTLVFVTHDRMFLRKLATRIFEIDRGRLFDWSCDYGTFLSRKEAALAAEETQNALFDKKLAEEEVWVRTGIKARRTRNEGRVRALEKLRLIRSDRREKTGEVQLAIQESERSGMLVAEVDGVSFAYGERSIVRDFSTSIMRGD